MICIWHISLCMNSMKTSILTIKTWFGLWHKQTNEKSIFWFLNLLPHIPQFTYWKHWKKFVLLFLLVRVGVTSIVVSSSNVVMVISRISIINSLDDHSFTASILFLNCTKHNFTCLTTLLVVGRWACWILLMVVLLLLVMMMLNLLLLLMVLYLLRMMLYLLRMMLYLLLLMVLYLLLLLLLMEFTIPPTKVAPVRLELVRPIKVLCHKWIGFFYCGSFRFDGWGLVFIWNHKAFLQGPSIWMPANWLKLLMDLVIERLPSKSRQQSPKNISHGWATVDEKLPERTKKALLQFLWFIFTWNQGGPHRLERRSLVWGNWSSFHHLMTSYILILPPKKEKERWTNVALPQEVLKFHFIFIHWRSPMKFSSVNKYVSTQFA